MLLILTSEQDLTADYLIVDLIRRQLPYFRLNTEELQSASFNFELNHLGTVRSISIGPKTADLDMVASVWYRRSIHPSPKRALTIAEQYFVSGELRHLAMGLVLNPKLVWVNPIDKVSVAEHKLYQLQVAASLGFRVPRTLVSADSNKLRNFATGNAIGTICKPISHGMFFDGISSHSVFTRKFDSDSLSKNSLRDCPILLQEEVPRKSDVRATFIGRHCFVVDIHSETPLVDWRDPSIDLDYSVSGLDGSNLQRCRQMLEKLGLIYGAFDFIRTPDNELVFLEVNPTGEWAWLEEKLDFPMREAFVEVFFEN